MTKKLFTLALIALVGSAPTADAFLGFGKKKEAASTEATDPGSQTVTVQSSLLKSISYDEATSTLVITLLDGDSYAYKKVPKSVYDALMAAESKGSYFVKNIRDKYKSSQN